MAKWKPVTFAELVANAEGNVPCERSIETSPGGSSEGANGLPKIGAPYWPDFPKANGSDGSTDSATFQGK